MTRPHGPTPPVPPPRPRVYLLEDEPREHVREVLQANMFDGDEGGKVTQSVSSLLTEMVEVLCGPDD